MSRVIGYEAKWVEDSFACIHTVRHFPEGPEDSELLRRMREIALASWRLCGLSGYARIDFRLGSNPGHRRVGRPLLDRGPSGIPGTRIEAALLQAAEAGMASAGRTRVYVETSTRPQYDPTRRFYLACGYGLAAELADFYAPGDCKAVFLKTV